jgi:hypothetical protein
MTTDSKRADQLLDLALRHARTIRVVIGELAKLNAVCPASQPALRRRADGHHADVIEVCLGGRVAQGGDRINVDRRVVRDVLLLKSTIS